MNLIELANEHFPQQQQKSLKRMKKNKLEQFENEGAVAQLRKTALCRMNAGTQSHFEQITGTL